MSNTFFPETVDLQCRTKHQTDPIIMKTFFNIFGKFLTKFQVNLGASNAMNAKTPVKMDLRELFPCLHSFGLNVG